MKAALLVILALLLGACDEPPRHSDNVREYLMEQGVSDDIIERLLMQAPLPAGVIEVLRGYGNVAVLHLVAANPGTPPSVLAELARHERIEVRTGVAANPGTPRELLETLREPGHYSALNTALARNPKLPPRLLQDMFTHGEALNSSFAMNPNTPPDVLRAIARDGEELDRIWLAGNPNLPDDVLQLLERDPSKIVRQRLANRNLRDDPAMPLAAGGN